MKECSKSIMRRLNDSNFIRKYFVGEGLDVGGKPDPLSLYAEFFPLVKTIRVWDLEDGDGQLVDSIKSESLDFVHSSHCLEHLVNPQEGLQSWFRVLRHQGYLIVTVPDEDLYEQGIFPSLYNKDHKWSFTIHKSYSWSSSSINVLDLIHGLGPDAEIIKIALIDDSYRYSFPKFDQTLTPVGESSIEFIVRKRAREEASSGYARRRDSSRPSESTLSYLNQYIDDLNALKKQNAIFPPFQNKTPL